MKRVAVVNYGAGNIDSVARAIAECGADPEVTDDPRVLDEASYIVLPGVGAFAKGMGNLRSRGLEEALNEQVVQKNVPFLGICLGMQLLASTGYEGGETPGLGWIDGEVTRLAPEKEQRIPHVGWNEVNPVFPAGEALFEGVGSGLDFYFVHSYHFRCKDPGAVMAKTPYGGGFVSAVAKDNIIGVQFHPEKSQQVGLKLFKNFLDL